VKLGTVRGPPGSWPIGLLDGLYDNERAGRPRTISDAQIEQVAPPRSSPVDATQWSRWSMSKNPALSASTIGRVWKAFRFQPHRVEKFELSTDPLFVDKLFDLVEFYLDPPAAVHELEGGGHAGLQRPRGTAPLGTPR
jgi:hypothetical protein